MMGVRQKGHWLFDNFSKQLAQELWVHWKKYLRFVEEKHSQQIGHSFSETEVIRNFGDDF